MSGWCIGNLLPLTAWQNITAAFLLLLWTVWIGYRRKRTPLELLMPSLDRRLVGLPPEAGSGATVVTGD